MKISRRHLAECIKKLLQKAWRTCKPIIFPHPTDQIIDLWRCHRRSRRYFLNFLLMETLRSHFVSLWLRGGEYDLVNNIGAAQSTPAERAVHLAYELLSRAMLKILTVHTLIQNT